MNVVEAGKRIMLRNILFTTDFSPCSDTALPYAVSLARKYGATLHAAHAMPTMAEIVFMSPEGWSTLADEIELQAERQIAELEGNLKEVPHRVLIQKGEISDVLGGIISQNAIDLVVLGTHGRTGIGKLVLGSTAEEIFRRARCPVLSVGPRVSHKPAGEAEFHHILFATDFSPESLAALPYAISLAEEDEAQVGLLHVVSQPAAGIVDLETVTAYFERRLRNLIPLDADPWCHAECSVEFGRPFASPAEGILRVANDSTADLIVLGVRSVPGKFGLITHLATTTAQILAHAACPILTVRG